METLECDFPLHLVDTKYMVVLLISNINVTKDLFHIFTSDLFL